MKKPLFQAIAQALASKNEEKIEELAKYLPSGSGFDAGSELLEESTPGKLIIQADFHHLCDNGYYVGWSEHKVIVTPSLAWGFDIKVTGRDRRQVKEYIADTFHHALSREVES